MAELKALAESVAIGDQARVVSLTKEALAAGIDPLVILNDGLIAGMNDIGLKFRSNEVYIPEVLIASRAMKMAMEVLSPSLANSKTRVAARVIIGTVHGDLHDIGRKLVAMMLRGGGFEVIDLGVDVAAETFVEYARQVQPHIVAMSALLTTTMPAMEGVVKALKDAGIKTKIMAGGSPVTQEYATRIGADGYAADACTAVEVAKALIGQH
jgi:5-methyltetrahydrofolate--homocysteine methyltransferase